MIIQKIVLTGGPCAGKSTALNTIQNYLSDKDFTVISVPETATELIKSGITPLNIGQYNFQKQLLNIQLQKERIYTECAEKLEGNVVIVFDRGALDGKAYLDEKDFRKLLDEVSLKEQEISDSYDAVFFLESAAQTYVGEYTLSNNSARSETAEEAILLNIKTFDVWKNHKNLIRIANEKSFAKKLDTLIVNIEQIISK